MKKMLCVLLILVCCLGMFACAAGHEHIYQANDAGEMVCTQCGEASELEFGMAEVGTMMRPSLLQRLRYFLSELFD